MDLFGPVVILNTSFGRCVQFQQLLRHFLLPAVATNDDENNIFSANFVQVLFLLRFSILVICFNGICAANAFGGNAICTISRLM